MANTQGMPDEFVASLMTATSAPAPNSTATSRTTAKKPMTAAAQNRQRKRLQERMELPLPQGGPAARILRPSPQSQNRDEEEEEVEDVTTATDDVNNNSSTSSTSTPPSFPILGDILERTPIVNNTVLKQSRNDGGKKKSSRFAAQQQKQQLSLNGFPSVHVPLGTFCQPSSSSSRPTSKRETGPPTTSPKKTDAVTATATATAANSSGITTESMLEAAGRDAEGMLQGMSPEEIKQQQHELTSALSPDLVAFLRQRRKGGQEQKSTTTVADAATTETTQDLPTPTPTPPPTRRTNRNTRKEKERMAELMSKVQTHQDLDQAYHSVMKDAHFLEAVVASASPGGEGNTTNDDGLGNAGGGVDSTANSNSKDDFALACDLLRSTNPRQTLWAARVVQRQLLEYVQQQQKDESSSSSSMVRDWPLVLPVSLRCLLDQPIQANSGYILHTYVLQSLYSLLLLTAHPDHIVRVLPDDTPTPAMVFAECFLDDAIPTPRLDTAYSATPIKPLTTTENNENKKDNDASPPAPAAPAAAAAYATQSSSTSAQTDGEAFDRDPMWTLLSKMKIVPRMAQLLAATYTNSSSSGYDWPPEAWTSLIGILCMIAQRSPGAASAIAHHDTILPRVVARILTCLQTEEDTPQNDNNNNNNSSFIIVFAAFQLFGTLARQSRVTAQSLPLVDVLPPLLARTPHTDLEFRVQQLGLQLWRTVLRYGLGLEALEAMTTAAARHWALPYTHPYSLSTEFVSALAQVLECAKLAKGKGAAILKTHDTSDAKLSATKVLSTLSIASTYLATTQRTVLLVPTTTVDSTSIESADESVRFRWNAARLRFLAQYWSLAETPTDDEASSSSSTAEEIKTEEWSMEQVLTCLEAMDEWTDAGALVQVAWSRLAKYASSTECYQDKERDSDSTTSIKCEAAASAFLDAFVQCLLSLATSPNTNGNRMIQELTRSVSKHFLQRILEGLRLACQQSLDSSSTSSVVSLAQRGWISQCHFAVSKVFSHCLAIGELQSSGDVPLIRMMVFHLLGRLDRGNESMAAVLFSQDALFQIDNPLETEEDSTTLPAGVTSKSSPISSMFLGELCGSEHARKQLDHSFKLQHGFGVTKDGLGAFALDSLLSNADQPKPSAATELALPLGELWLWQSLSGQVRTKEERTVAQGFHEATNVVAAVLGLLMELEEAEDLLDSAANSSMAGYSARIPLGAKLYYLMNVCLQTEVVLREARVQELAEVVLERYWPRLNRTSSILEFSQACLQHTEPAKTTASSDADTLDEKDKKLFELFNPEIPNEVALSSAEMRSLEAFLDDMAEAYNDYGAQYDFFTKCMRLFLLPIFPWAIRRRMLRELRGILQLLTLPTEMEHQEEFRTLLNHSVTGGTKTEGARDPPEFLDAVTVIMVPNSGPRPLTGYMLAYSVAIMARNLTMALQQSEGLDVMKKRLAQLDARTTDLICHTSSDLVDTTKGTKEELVDATLKSLSAVEQPAQGGTTLSSYGRVEERVKLLQDKFGGSPK